VSAPRQVLPGRYYLISRRCTQRQFLLKPCKATRDIVMYCLAEAAGRFKMDVICVMVMGNHIHMVVRDRLGNYPAFLHRFHCLTAKALNCHWGRWENLWAAEQGSVVWLVEPEDVFGKMIYALCNPVESHLVTHVTHWPGANSFDAQLHDKTLSIDRPRDARRRQDGGPRSFFTDKSSLPDRVTLRFTRPPGFEHLSHEQWSAHLRAAIAAEEHRFAAERAAKKTRVVGRKNILARSAFDEPTTHEPRRVLSPRVACKNKRRRIQALQSYAEFRVRYRAALERRRMGDPDVLFPAGTYHFSVLGLVLVRCVPPPPPPPN
jgi:REP element-mobilizing transposase RayT